MHKDFILQLLQSRMQPIFFLSRNPDSSPPHAPMIVLTSWLSFWVWQQVQQDVGVLPCWWPSWTHWTSLIPIWTALVTDTRTFPLILTISKKKKYVNQPPVTITALNKTKRNFFINADDDGTGTLVNKCLHPQIQCCEQTNKKQTDSQF